jgi:hypothetical protein
LGWIEGPLDPVVLHNEADACEWDDIHVWWREKTGETGMGEIAIGKGRYRHDETR